MKTSSFHWCRLLRWLCPGVSAILLLGHSSPAAAQLFRGEAVEALLAPGSGVTILTNVVAVWSPYDDLGGGPGREGMLPAGTTVAPRFLGVEPFPGSQMSVTDPSYFFWIDDAASAKFAHATRFVLVRADLLAAPTVANGGILVSEQGWWPLIHLPSVLVPDEYFSTIEERVTSLPAGPANPDGLVAGVAPAPGDLMPPAAAGPFKLLSVPASMMGSSSNAAGLIISGHNDAQFSNDVRRYERDLTNHYGIRSNRVIIANGGSAATTNQIAAAISNLCNLQPPPDKIYVRITAHGGVGIIGLGGATVSAEVLCQLLKKLADKGKPICLLIDACHSESLVDSNRWGFAVGSVIIVTASTNGSAFGGSFTNGTFSVFSDAFSRCLNSTNADSNTNGIVEDGEAYHWVTNQNPCYLRSDYVGKEIVSNVMVYPASGSTGWPPFPFPPENYAALSNEWYKLTNGYPNPGPKVFVVTPPRLEIKKSNDNQMDLRWPINPPHFGLEYSPELPGAIWQPVHFLPVEEDDYNVVRIPTSFFGNQAFFRLIHQPPAGDTTPPTLVSAQVVGPLQVKVTFSEPLDPATANQFFNYRLAGLMGPIFVVGAFVTPDGAMVILQLHPLPPLLPGSYTVTVNNVTDLAGNPIAPDSTINFMTP